MANRTASRFQKPVASAASNPENALFIDLGNGAFAEAVGSLLYLLSGGTPVAWDGKVGTIAGAVKVGQDSMTAGAKKQLNGGTSIASTNGVIVQALSGNSASVYVGDSTVTTSTGFELQPGQAVSLSTSNINNVYIIGTGTDGVCWNVV